MDAAHRDTEAIANYTATAKPTGFVDCMLNLVPTSMAKNAIVIVAGVPFGSPGTTNLLRIAQLI